ncbi:hypothetical protein M441DRAFT_130225 [Trichoderma asperellum CBS 433.97]|uniref:SSCRP protein n=1 Tax=Trichoderma asperellum (strain ATCC 204424 / CBS 433.97 / NBRC 101777) TaxID=1042311 RepID=A0A2T3ZKD1_TRIA4|nr:hypothetical protein M441DRAFT_130225 [Trichoderma asperellum CBS 433.97]PTB45267.1 hypothetical protein M441DRAFT_130225 [Trichoderma asperellum CBS 433.97]
MQFSVLSLIFASVAAAQNVATLFSEPDFKGSTYDISGTDDALGVCNPVTGFPNVKSIKVKEGHACVLYNTATCDVPYAAYQSDTANTIVNGAFSAFSCAVSIPGGPFGGN